MNIFDLFETPGMGHPRDTKGIQSGADQSAASVIGSGTTKREEKKKPVRMMGMNVKENVEEAAVKPNFKMPPESLQDKMYRQHQELRKQRGAPSAEEYKQRIAQKQAEIDALKESSYASDKNYQEAPEYKNYKIYVGKKPFVKQSTGEKYYIAVTNIGKEEIKQKGTSAEEAVAAIHDKIDFVLNAQQKVSANATLDFNVKFATDILSSPREPFFAKVENRDGEPKLIIASKDWLDFGKDLVQIGFKPSALRIDSDSETSTPLPSISYTKNQIANTGLIANGRYEIGHMTTDKDGFNIFDLTYHSTAHTKSDKMRLNKPAVTVGTVRSVGVTEGILDRAAPKLPKPRNPADQVLQSKVNAGGRHLDKKRRQELNPKHKHKDPMAESLRPGERHHFETDPETGKRVYKGIRGDQYDAPKRGTDDPAAQADQERKAHIQHDRSMTEQEVDGGSIGNRKWPLPKGDHDDEMPGDANDDEMGIDETIRKINNQYRLYSKKGKNLGTFPSKAGAEKHEREVQYFKHKNMEESIDSKFVVTCYNDSTKNTETILIAADDEYDAKDKINYALGRGSMITDIRPARGDEPTDREYKAFREPRGGALHVGIYDREQGVAEGSENNGISFKVQKGKNKFATTLSVGVNPVGVYQYDADTGRSVAEVYPEFKGKGLGKLLVLHAIYTAAKLGLDFQEDESRTSEYNNVLDSLSSNGYIVDDDGYWYVTGEGEQYLQHSLKQGVAEAVVIPFNTAASNYVVNIEPKQKQEREAAKEKEASSQQFPLKDQIKEFAPTPDFGDGRRDDGEYMPLSEYADIIEQYLGRSYTREDRRGGAKHLPQVSVRFIPKDKSHDGLIIYSFIHPKRGEYGTHNTIILQYDEQGMGHGKKGPSAVPKTQKQALKIAQLIGQQGVAEGIKSKIAGAALAGAAALGGGHADAQQIDLPGPQSVMVAHIVADVNGREVNKTVNLGNQYQSKEQAEQDLEDYMQSKGITRYSIRVEQSYEQPSGYSQGRSGSGYATGGYATAPTSAPGFGDYMINQMGRQIRGNQPDRGGYATGGSNRGERPRDGSQWWRDQVPYMREEALEEDIERHLLLMRRAGYDIVQEEWSDKYKRSIDCSHPKGFSQKAHCAGRKKNEGVAEGSLNEFLDDRKGDDGEGISKIVSTTDRLLKQGYKVDLAVIGAMGRVYRADLDQTGFTPNGALAIKRKTKHFIRPFRIDDDDKYEFELVAPKHYKIVDSFTKSDDQGVAEEKVRLDPKCWSGKKIGNPKTKMKGGVRVNNCVPK